MISFFDTLGISGIKIKIVSYFYTQYCIIPPFQHSIRRADTTPVGCNQSRILWARILYFFSVVEGGGVLTPVVGYFIDQFGFYISFTICGAKMVIATLICSIFLIPRARIPHETV